MSLPQAHLPAAARFDSLDELAVAARACTACALASGRMNVVVGVGRADADLMFVGEAPGAEEDRTGEPFVGRAGRLLTQLVEGIGLTRADVYITNVVKCRPPGNRDPLPAEIDACRPFLAEQLRLVQPRVVVTLGNFATKLLVRTKVGITRLRGRELAFVPPSADGALPSGDASGVTFGDVSRDPSEPAPAGPDDAVVVIPTLHPSAVLRSGGSALAQARADFVVVKRALARRGSA